MLTFSICLLLVILAIINAVFAQQTSDWVLPANRDLYYPPFLKSEGFYRAFLINLSFAGISVAATGIQHVRYVEFWMISDPLLAIFLNLGVGLFVAISLKSESAEISTDNRRWWVRCLLAVGLLLFAFSVWTSVGSGSDASENSNDPPAMEVNS